MSNSFKYDYDVKIQKHYKIREVAEMLSVSTKTVYRWINDRRLKAHRIGGSIRIPRSELLKIIEEI